VSIGANWAEIWAPVWKAVWTQTAPEPEPEPEPTQRAAGRRRRKERFFVEIDGQEFEVSSPFEALSLLARAKEMAVAQIEKARASPVRVAHGIKHPRIRTDAPALRSVVQQARKEITSLYDAAIRDFEIAALMQAAEDEEEETIIRLLM
jgi:hypothetical protein